MVSRRPRIYISSTIFDFSDLRSALKFYLEQQGCEVLLSEFNDFGNPLDANSYDACLKTIDSCDYFVLLVGSRVGGWYDIGARVTITRMEYRRAYERAVEGRIRLVNFVRHDIWTIREDRKGLAELCKAIEIGHAERTISNHPSKFVNDAEFIFDFIREVGRVDEMKSAIKSVGSFPTGNWIHQFRSFEDVIDVLAVQLDLNRRVERVALEHNLRNELLDNLRALSSKYKNAGVLPHFFWAGPARRQMKGDSQSQSSLSADAIKELSFYAVVASAGPNEISTRFIDEALRSGEFLEFERLSRRYVDTELLTLLRALRKQIALLLHRTKSFQPQCAALSANFKELGDLGRTVRVPNSELVGLLCIHDSQFNVVALCDACLQTINGAKNLSRTLKLYRMSPFEGSDVEAGTPTDKDLEAMLEDLFRPQNERGDSSKA